MLKLFLFPLFLSAGNAESRKTPETERYRTAEQHVVSHADDPYGHDHEKAAKAKGAGKAILPLLIDTEREISLGKDGANKCKAPGNAHFSRHIEIHVMGMENKDSRFLDEEIIFRIGKEIGPPADTEEWMIFNHGSRAFPESIPEADRCIFSGEKREEPFHNLSVVEEKNYGHQKEEETESSVIEQSEAKYDSPKAEPCTS